MSVTTNCKAKRLSQQILTDIQSGQYKRGQLLPPENDIAGRYKVSRSTVRRAISLLSNEDKLVKLPQRGVQVPLSEDYELAGLSAVTTEQAVASSTSSMFGTMAAIWAAVPNYHIIKMREGIQRYAKEHGYDFRIFLSPKGHEQALEVLSDIRRHGVTGAVVLPYNRDSYRRVLGGLCDSKFPLVSVISVDELPVPSVETDSFGALYMATNHLLERHRRPVYFLTMPLEDNVIRDRYYGYSKAMADAGFSQDVIDSHILEQDTTGYEPEYWGQDKDWMPAYRRLESFFDNVDFPISIACLNDDMAQAVYKAARAHNKVVGREVAVTGVGDLPLSRFLEPALTTVASPPEDVGYEAGKMLHRAIRGIQQEAVHVQLPVELVVRQSS